MRVLFVSSEIYPLAKTGGLADVSAALPRALAGLGLDVHLVLPGYPHALEAAADKRIEAELPAPELPITELSDSTAEMTRLVAARMPDSGLLVHLVDCPSLFAREGTLYQDWQGQGERGRQHLNIWGACSGGITMSFAVPSREPHRQNDRQGHSGTDCAIAAGWAARDSTVAARCRLGSSVAMPALKRAR
jgi:hypothetical protein